MNGAPYGQYLIDCLGLAAIILQLLEYIASILLLNLPQACQSAGHRIPATAFSHLECQAVQFTIWVSSGQERGT